MKSIVIIFSLSFLSINLFGQFESSHNVDIDGIKNPLSYRNKRDIFEEGLYNYFEQIEIFNGYANPVGYITKFIYISEDSIVFSMNYFYEKEDLKRYKPISYYSEVMFKPLLFISSDSIKTEFDSFMNEFGQDKYTKADYEAINFLDETNKVVSVDCYFIGVAVYSKGVLNLKIYRSNRIPLKYSPEQDKNIIKARRYIEYYNSKNK